MRYEDRPMPARITLALDVSGLSGDQVDRDLGVWESPDGEWIPGTAVDRWENGTLTPTREQMGRLAEMCGVLVDFFYRWECPVPDRVLLCDRSRRVTGLTIITARVDPDGVIHTAAVTPRQQRSVKSHPIGRSGGVPSTRTGVHEFRRDPETGLCGCGLPDGNRWHVVQAERSGLEQQVYDPQRRAAGERPDDE